MRLSAVFLLVLLCPALYPQARPGGTAPKITDPARMPQNPAFNDLTLSYFVAGVVKMEDGNPPPEPVTIERICHQFGIDEGLTDDSGKFEIQLGRNTQSSGNATVANEGEILGQSRMNAQSGTGGAIQALAGCSLRAKVPGFKSDQIPLDHLRSGSRNDLGQIIIHPMSNVKGLPFSGTTGLAPKDARKSYLKGQELLAAGKWENAQKEFEKATKGYPKFAAAWYELGLVCHDHGQLEEARKAYTKAIEADTNFVRPYAELSRLSAMQRNWREAVEWSDKVITLNPFVSADSFFYGAVGQFNLKNAADAEERARKAAALDTAHKNPKIQQLLAAILQQKGDAKGAAEQLKAYLQYAPDAKDAAAVRQKLAALESQ